MSEGKVADKPIDMSEHGFEYETVCATPSCKNAARWAGWVSHSAKVCPNSSFACNACKATVTDWWSGVIVKTETHDVACVKCKVPLEGALSDNLRWIPL